MDEETLEKMALEEIMKDIKRGAERAQEHGALGWQKSTAPPPNKTFLRNMLMSTLTDRTRKISHSSSRLRAMTGCGQQFSKQQHTDSAGLSSSSFSVTHRATVDQPSAGHTHHRKRKLNFYHDSSNANDRSHQHKSVESTCQRLSNNDNYDITKEDEREAYSVSSYRQRLFSDRGTSCRESKELERHESVSNATRNKISRNSSAKKDESSTIKNGKEHPRHKLDQDKSSRKKK